MRRDSIVEGRVRQNERERLEQKGKTAAAYAHAKLTGSTARSGAGFQTPSRPRSRVQELSAGSTPDAQLGISPLASHKFKAQQYWFPVFGSYTVSRIRLAS
jgi:hypothetical protein